ncbi:7385_t:CDS:2 [Gigaspora margarita]|uniref:7385_t:CDS:1 n=1 Tax=Gigaspora margarita TaxID=4874 RepID=A0ABN7UNN9_GIGMA|nr:7385_t:CDS:2 [Gigaspora margarita]
MEDYDSKQKMNEEIRKNEITETIQEKIETIQEYQKMIYKAKKLEMRSHID